MPSLTQLQYIVQVHKTQNFAKAARECCVSQPSLSAQIQKVEQELETIIFDRSKRPILTTAKGLHIIAQAKIILKEHAKLYELVNDEKGPAGNFELGVIPTLAPYLLPLFIESFSKKYPDVQLNINEYKTEDIIEKLHGDEIDAAILATPLLDDKIIEQKLFLEPFYAFVSQHHECAHRKLIKDDDLKGKGLWLLSEGHCFRNQVIKLCHTKQGHALQNIRFEGGSLETLKNIIRQGKGHTLLPFLATLNLSEEERRKHLKRFQRPVPSREIGLVYSINVLKKKIIHALYQEILTNLPEELIKAKAENLNLIPV